MAKQIYIDSNGNEVLVSGTITNDNNLPHFSGTPTAGTTAEAIASIPVIKTKEWSSGGNFAIDTLYQTGVYYGNITLGSGFSDVNEILSVTMTDYGGLKGLLMFQIVSTSSIRVWTNVSQTMTLLKVKVVYK